MAKFKTTAGGGSHDSLDPLRTQFPEGTVIFVEGDLGQLNQVEPGIVEIGAHVRIDRIKWIDIRATDQDGKEIKYDSMGQGRSGMAARSGFLPP